MNRGKWVFILLGTALLFLAGVARAAFEISNNSAIALWHFNGNSNDASSTYNGADTTITYSSSTEILSQGAGFNGSTSKINFGNNFDMTGTETRSWSLWFKPSSLTGIKYIFAKGNDVHATHTAHGYWLTQVYQTIYWTMNAGSGFGNNEIQLETSGVLTSTSTWYHVVVTYDGSKMASGIHIYVNNADQALTVEQNTLSNSITNSVNFMAGTSSDGTRYNDMDIDEFTVFNAVVSTSTIGNLWNGGNGQEICLTMRCGTPSLTLSSLRQYKSDATTTVIATTTESTVVFGANLQSTGASTTLQLQVEVQPAGTSFTSTPNSTSTLVSSGSNATTTFGTSTLVYPRDPESWSNGSFHWQARAQDANGVTSTWQLFGANASSTDFRIKTVPLYTQETSTYPSVASTSVWATALYDNALPGTQCPPTGGGVNSSTIQACGCSITSVVMWLRYFGITTDTLGKDVNPLNLNTWLASSTGYDPVGNLIWNKVTGYASSTSGAIVWDSNSFSYGTSSNALRPYIDSLLSSSTPDPVILFEDNVPDNNATTTHFVVAIGSSINAGTSTYAVRDSFWYNTQYLNQATSSATAGTIKGYSNNINGVRIYYDPPQVPLWGEYHVNAPNALMLVDSQGRRTGKDPATGILYREIPGTSYGEESGTPGHRSGELFTSNLPDGQYTLYILGGQTGAYWLGASHDGQQDQTFRGNIQSGSMIAYTQNYNSANLISSTFSFSSTASSTASITSAPPNNLPPPPVPKPVTPPPPVPSPPTPPTISTSTPLVVSIPVPLPAPSATLSTSSTGM